MQLSRLPSRNISRRLYHDYIKFKTGSGTPAFLAQMDHTPTHNFIGGIIRVPLNNQRVVGVSKTRGPREYVADSVLPRKIRLNYFASQQEDSYSFAQLSLNPEELRLSLKKQHDLDWDPKALSEESASEVFFVGIYDGLVPICSRNFGCLLKAF